VLRVLIVEDDTLKAKEVSRVCENAVEVDLDIVETVYAAGQKMKEIQYDLMVLDVKLPMRQNTDASADAGVKLLQQLKTRHELKIPLHVIGLTAYDESLDEFKKQFEDFTWVLMYYDPSSDLWIRQLTNWLQHAVNVKNIAKQQDFETDIAIITALQNPELDEILKIDANWKRKSIPGDDTFYHTGVFTNGIKNLTVVAASAIQMGMPATTGLAMKICRHFKPRYLTMTGVAAGVKGNYGDILVADRSWDYGSGKIRLDVNASKDQTSVFEPAPTAIPLDVKLLEKLKMFVCDKNILKNIELNWEGVRTVEPLDVMIGPIASGASVIENRTIIDAIKSHNRKLVGVEMEIYGLFLAAQICPGPRPTALAIKSICDFGDPNKVDVYQRYAAYTSSRFLHQFAISELTQ